MTYIPKELLSVAEIEEIKDAIEDVTFTFFKTPILYQKAVPALSRFNEDDSHSSFDEYNFNGLVEYAMQTSGLTSSDVKFSKTGAIDKSKARITVNIRNLITVGLFDEANSKPLIESETDYAVFNNEKYKITKYNMNSPIDRQNVVLEILCELVVKNEI